jgi:NTE family protein
MRYTAGAVDLESGDDVYFDTDRQTVSADHVRASASLLPTFPPVEIDGRAYVDGGLSSNLPLDPVLAAPPAGTTLCITADLLPLADRRPRTLGESMSRAQNLTFAAQSRRTIEHWKAVYALDPQRQAASVTLVRLSYTDQASEVAGKAMDFSPESIRHRWQAGHRDTLAMLARLTSDDIALGRAGLTISQME